MFFINIPNCFTVMMISYYLLKQLACISDLSHFLGNLLMPFYIKLQHFFLPSFLFLLLLFLVLELLPNFLKLLILLLIWSKISWKLTCFSFYFWRKISNSAFFFSFCSDFCFFFYSFSSFSFFFLSSLYCLAFCFLSSASIFERQASCFVLLLSRFCFRSSFFDTFSSFYFSFLFSLTSSTTGFISFTLYLYSPFNFFFNYFSFSFSFFFCLMMKFSTGTRVWSNLSFFSPTVYKISSNLWPTSFATILSSFLIYPKAESKLTPRGT